MNSSITPFVQLIVCLSAALGTYQLIHRFHFSAIRASAFITCLFCLIVLFSGQSILKTQEALFFGGTIAFLSCSSVLLLKKYLFKI